MAGDVSKSLMTVALVVACLLLANASPGFSSPDAMAEGMLLAAGPIRHVIRAGETINVLAKRYGVPAAAILKANPSLNPSRLALGKEIIIPLGAGTVAPSASDAAETPKSVELRPEKAPQATKPLTALHERDLADSPATPPAAQQAAPPERGTAAVGQAAAATTQAAKAEESQPQAEASRPAQPGPSDARVPGPAPVGSGVSERIVLPAVVAVLVLLALVYVLRGFFANSIAGLAISLLRFFRLGDSIRVAGHTGRVIARGWLYVTLRTPDNERVFVSNARVLREILVILPPSRDDVEV